MVVQQKMRIVDPTGFVVPRAHQNLAPRVDTLTGKVVGFLDNKGLPVGGGRVAMDAFMAALRDELQHRFAIGGTLWHRKPNSAKEASPQVIEEFVAKCDMVINGSCVWGSCTSASVRDAITLEKRGIPTITISHDVFEKASQSQAACLGMPDLPLLVIPQLRPSAQGDNPQLMTHIQKVAAQKVAVVVSTLTRARPVKPE